MGRLKWWVGYISMVVSGEPEKGALAWWVSQHPDLQDLDA
jgi:hypothetical protein